MSKTCEQIKLIFGLPNSVLMGLGQEQQQHPVGEFAGGGSLAVAVDVSDRGQVAGDTQHTTCDI